MSLVDQRYAILNNYLRRRPEEPNQPQGENLGQEGQNNEVNQQDLNENQNREDEDNNMLINQLI